MKDIYSELFLGVGREFQLALYALAVGAAMGAIYDLFRIVRLSIKHNRLVVMAEDVLFTLLFGMVYYTFSVELTKGAMRFFVFIGMLLGFGIYLDSLGRIIFAISARIIKLAKMFIGRIVKIAKKIYSNLCVTPFFHKQTKKPAETSCRTEQGDV